MKDNSATDAEPCVYRLATENSQLFYCRHTDVRTTNNLVPLAVCDTCVVRSTPCESPRPEDRLPSLATMSWNAARAVGSFISDGMNTVSRDEYQRRMEICDGCEFRQGDRCTQCGCRLSWKAQGRTFRCPDGRWTTGEEGTRHDDTGSEATE